MKFISLMALIFSSYITAHSRPVSYPSGWTLMQVNEMDKHSLHIHFSPSAKYSVGYKGEYWSDQNIRLNTIQYNRLIKRWNQPQEQANFYWKAGIGTVDINDSNQGNQLAYFTGFAIDWETRRYFTSYENKYYDLNHYGNHFSHKARVGIAPYIGDYGDFHTWLMLQVDHTSTDSTTYQSSFESNNKSSTVITPMLRFFKGPVMVEAGYSNQDDILFNFIYRL